MTNQEQYNLVWEKAKKYDKLVNIFHIQESEIMEVVPMLKIIKEQAVKSCNDTAIIDVKIDSFNFVIDSTIELLECINNVITDTGSEVLKC